MSQEKALSNLLITLIFYLATLFISGIYKINSIGNYLDKELVISFKISAYTSLLVSSIISIIAILLILLILILIKNISNVFMPNIFIIVGFRSLTFVFIIFEMIKLYLTFLTIDKDLINLNNSIEIVEQIKSSNWFLWQSTLNFISLIISSLIFGLTLRIMTGKKDLLNIVLFSVIVWISFYISNIDFFNSI